MLPFNIDYRRLIDKAEIEIHEGEFEHIQSTLESGMYEPCGIYHRREPIFRKPGNIFKIVHVKALEKEMDKWERSGKLWVISTKQNGIKVRISVEVAIVLFEICDASNNDGLDRLMGNIQLHLKNKFNILLEPNRSKNHDY